MRNARLEKLVPIAALLLATLLPRVALRAQHTHGHPTDSTRLEHAADAAMSGPLSANARAHLELTPLRTATRADSAKARKVVAQLRAALARYADTTAAVADGYRMFLPELEQQRVFHFTNYRLGAAEAFRFDPAKPTSLLYEHAPVGRMRLAGAMYTAPKRMRIARLDGRIPISIARWHKHVNWCIPEKGSEERWLERRNGAPVFGPESPIVTRAECDAVGGRFFASPLGWMIHVNAFVGEDLGAIFAHDH
jgi:hypothetical protein